MSKSVLVLRACHSDMSSSNDFVWPAAGYVEAPDWEPTPVCGNGLHGWQHGHGEGNVSNFWDDDCKWLIVKVKVKDLINLGDKVKFKCGKVVFCGDRKGATDYLLANDPVAYTKPVIGAIIVVGDDGTATTGYKGSSTSGDNGSSISGIYGESISGYEGTSISGFKGYAKSGVNGSSTSGYMGTSISGHHGTSITGEFGSARSGPAGNIVIKYYRNGRFMLKTGNIGFDGLKPDVLYTLNASQEFIVATE